MDLGYTAAAELLGIIGKIVAIYLFTHRLQSRERAGCKSSNKTLVPHHTIQCCKAGLNVTHQTWSCILVRQNICQKFGVLSSLTPRLISPRTRMMDWWHVAEVWGFEAVSRADNRHGTIDNEPDIGLLTSLEHFNKLTTLACTKLTNSSVQAQIFFKI